MIQNVVLPAVAVSSLWESELQGEPIGLRVRDAGREASESPFVMRGIGVRTLPHAKAGRLPAGVSSRESLANHLKTGRQMTVRSNPNGCARYRRNRVAAPRVYREVHRGQASVSASYLPVEAFEMLERLEGKLSRAVPRGGGGGNVASLPDRLNPAI